MVKILGAVKVRDYKIRVFSATYSFLDLSYTKRGSTPRRQIHCDHCCSRDEGTDREKSNSGRDPAHDRPSYPSCNHRYSCIFCRHTCQIFVPFHPHASFPLFLPPAAFVDPSPSVLSPFVLCPRVSCALPHTSHVPLPLPFSPQQPNCHFEQPQNRFWFHVVLWWWCWCCSKYRIMKPSRGLPINTRQSAAILHCSARWLGASQLKHLRDLNAAAKWSSAPHLLHVLGCAGYQNLQNSPAIKVWARMGRSMAILANGRHWKWRPPRCCVGKRLLAHNG